MSITDVEKANEDVEAYMSGRHEGNPDELTRVKAKAEAAEKMTVPVASFRDFANHYSKWKNAKVLIGTAGSWFCLDVAYYGLSLNTATIIGVIGYATTSAPTVYDYLYNTAIGNLIVILAGAVPGYWFSVATIDIVGRKPIQMMGFMILTVLFIVWGFAYNSIPGNGQLAIYVLAQFFFNFGPNTTTFIVPGEVFPTRYRSTCHGISAASGKIGSIIGQGAIAQIRTIGATSTSPQPYMDHTLEVFSLFMLIGCFTTLLIPETARKTLEQLSGEDDDAVINAGREASSGGVLNGDGTGEEPKTAIEAV